MAKLSAEDKRKITIEYAAGATQRELAKKFTTSPTTISKILRDQKSLQKLTNAKKVDKECNESLKNKAHRAITQIIDSLPKDLLTAPLRDKITAMERLKDMFGLPEENDEEVTGIVVEIEDASGDTDDD